MYYVRFPIRAVAVEIRQLRYFIRIVELGSMGRAAADLGVVTSTLSQQISRLENELATRLLQRTSNGVKPTEAGLAFWRHAQLAIRHIDQAANAAHHARLSGHVSVGMAPSTTGVLGLPFMTAMRERYPELRLRLVESLSGDLDAMLKTRKIDLAILFQSEPTKHLSAIPLLHERLFAIAAFGTTTWDTSLGIQLSQLANLSLILPSNTHGLRMLVDAAFKRNNLTANLVAEIDGLAMLMEAVGGGLGISIQPGAALARLDPKLFSATPILDDDLGRQNVLVSLSDDELTPPGLAARVVLVDVAKRLVDQGKWAGASLHNP